MVNQRNHELDDFLGPEIEGNNNPTEKHESDLKKAEREVQEALLRYSGGLLISEKDYQEAQTDIRILASIHAQRLHAKNQEINHLQQVLKGEDKYAHKGSADTPLSASNARQNMKHFGLAFERLTKVFNRPEYTDLVQAIFRLENLRKKELTEKDKQIKSLRANLKEAQTVRAKLKTEFRQSEEERKSQEDGENKDSIKPEPSLTPDIDALEDELLEQLKTYREKKIFKGHPEKLLKEFKKLGYTYELIWGDKWKEARALRKALESSNGEPTPQPIKRAGSTDLLKTHLKEVQILMRGISRLAAISPVQPLVITPAGITTAEFEKRAYTKVLVAFEKLQHMRRKETARLNREIRNLRKALKEKKEARRDSTEIWDLEDGELPKAA